MYGRTTLGIDISNTRISLALVSQTDKGIELLKSACAPVPEGAMAEGNIENAQILAKAVKELCSRNKMPMQHAVVSLAAKPAVIRVIELPKDLPGNPSQYVRDELKHYAVMSGKTIMHDYCALAPQKKSWAARLLVAATDEEKIVELVKAFNRVSISIEAVEPGVLAWIRLLHASHLAKKFSSNVLLAVVQDTTTTLCAFSNANLDFVQTAEIGEHDLESEQGAQSLVTEIHAIRQFYDVEVEDTPKTWELIVALSGETQKYDTLQQIIKNGFADTNVRISSPSTLREDAQLILREQTHNASPISVGLSMRKFKAGSADLKINLLPAGADQIHDMQKFALMTVGVAIIFLILSFAAVSLLKTKLIAACQAIAEYQQAQSVQSAQILFIHAAILEQNNKSLAEQMQALNVVVDSSRAARDWAKVLTDISDRTPENVRIISLMTKDNSTMHVSGQAVSYDDINRFVKLLDKSPYLSSATLAKSEIDPLTQGLLSYDITCTFAVGEGEAHAD